MKTMGEHWWRIALIAAAATVAVWPWNPPSVLFVLFGLAPMLIWCGIARDRRTGLTVGLILLALLTWFVVPRGLGFSGRWVPSDIEVLWLHSVLGAVVCGIGARADHGRRAGSPRLPGAVFTGCFFTAFLFSGFLFAGLTLVLRHEGPPPGDEGVLPGPPGLSITEHDPSCGSGGCSRTLDAIGDRASERTRQHLTDQGFTPRPTHSPDIEQLCRTTGLVTTQEVCAELRTVAPDTVRVLWYV
ncbi:hypothetical protein [Actinokineospora iranica]|uniref:Uncharacterized protein n=1 Tax=Actinokineospora iranica TaxID=1271860 RepID=A0A1G6YH84_9PSEU|nr:hypothetical protein [Actinokineospora iranica]SDD88985.1 hypothetical protein SAMN05216174_12155 [Actinokineospora iranica]